MKRHILVPLGLALVLVAGGIWYMQGLKQVTGAKTTTSTAPTHTSDQPKNTTPPPNPAPPTTATLSHTDPASIWVVVNKQHPLNPKTYTPSDLVNVGNGQNLRSEAATSLSNMIAGAKQAGLTLTPASGYRSYDTQVSVYNSEVKSYGQARADTESARPGYSEHQTGLAMDIAGGGCNIDDCFANTAEGKWTAANAYKYGYILRYTADNSAVTGYRAEAWHFRYVGTQLAGDMHTSGVTTLEAEFHVSGGNY